MCNDLVIVEIEFNKHASSREIAKKIIILQWFFFLWGKNKAYLIDDYIPDFSE